MSSKPSGWSLGEKGAKPAGYPASIPKGEFWLHEITNEAASLLPHIPEDQLVLGAEVGVYMAKTATILLHRRPRLRLYLVDSWETLPETKDLTIKHLTAAGVIGRTTILHGDSAAMAGLVRDEILDYAFIDASKASEKYLADCRAWWPKVRSRGFIQGHDWDHPNVPGCVEEFAGELGLPFTVNEKRKSWMIRKG